MGTAYPGGLLSGRASRWPLLRGTAAPGPLGRSAQHLGEDQGAQCRLLRLPRCLCRQWCGSGGTVADAILSQVMPWVPPSHLPHSQWMPFSSGVRVMNPLDAPRWMQTHPHVLYGYGVVFEHQRSRGVGWGRRGHTHPQDGDKPPVHPAPLHHQGRPAQGGEPGSSSRENPTGKVMWGPFFSPVGCSKASA